MKRFRNNKKRQLPTRYILWILTGICVIGIFVGLVFNIKGGPLNALAGYIFVPIQIILDNFLTHTVQALL